MGAMIRLLFAGVVAVSWFVSALAAFVAGVDPLFCAGMAALGAWAWYWTRRNESLYAQADKRGEGWMFQRGESWFHLFVAPALSIGVAWWLLTKAAALNATAAAIVAAVQALVAAVLA